MPVSSSCSPVAVASRSRSWPRTLAASRETIRRDLATLDGRGLARRVHGGALSREDGGAPVEGPFAARRLENVEAKRAVARAAAATLGPGDSLFVDTGTTTLHFADELARVEGLTVVTNSAAIAERAGRARGSTVYLLGGEFRPEARETVGAMTLAQIGELRAAHAFPDGRLHRRPGLRGHRPSGGAGGTRDDRARGRP